MWARLTTGARDTSQSASAYVERQRKLSALRGEVRAAEVDRGGLYTQMGRKVYALHLKEKVANRDLLRSCQEIDELGTLIEAKRTQIEALLSIPDDEEIELEDETEVGQEEEGEAEEPEEPAEEEEEKEEEVAAEAAHEAEEPEEPAEEEEEKEEEAEEDEAKAAKE